MAKREKKLTKEMIELAEQGENMETRTMNVLQKNGQGEPRQLIEVLLDVQEKDGFLSEPVLRQISENLQVPLAEVWSVANFYNVLSLEPRGKHLVTVCMGTACHVRNAPLLLEEARGQLGVDTGSTTEDGLFTVEKVNCLGACGVGPVVVMDDKYHQHMRPAKLRKLIRAARKAEKEEGTNA